MKLLLFVAVLAVLLQFATLTSAQAALECDTCTFLLKQTEQYIEANSTIIEIVAALNVVCSDIPFFQKECDDLIKILDKEFPKIPFMLNHSIYTPFAVCSIMSVCTVPCCLTTTEPEQIHLSITEQPSEMVITWVTSTSDTGTPLIYYGLDSSKLFSNIQANTTTYTSGGWLGQIHSGVITGLKSSTQYYYRVGSLSGGWSQVYSFTTRAMTGAPNQYPVSFAVVADMGASSASNLSVEWLTKQTVTGEIDAVLHVGDIGYADGFQQIWDVYLRKVEPIAARIPYQTICGNHEIPFNFTAYKTRFFTGAGPNMYYAFTYSNIRIIAIDTESEIDTAEIDDVELQWIENELQYASTGNFDWIIVMGHRPFYCSCYDDDCEGEAVYLRGKMEDMMYKYKVDLIFSGHLHNYERSYPLYQNKKMANSYVNAPAPVYVLNGVGGNREGLEDHWMYPQPDWSAYRVAQDGYAVLNVWNSTHLTYSLYSDTSDTVIDTFTLVKT